MERNLGFRCCVNAMDMQEFILFKLRQPAPIAFHVEKTDSVRRNEYEAWMEVVKLFSS